MAAHVTVYKGERGHVGANHVLLAVTDVLDETVNNPKALKNELPNINIYSKNSTVDHEKTLRLAQHNTNPRGGGFTKKINIEYDMLQFLITRGWGFKNQYLWSEPVKKINLLASNVTGARQHVED